MDKELRESLNLGKKIKRIRQDKGMRLSDLATMTEYSISFLSQLENNKISPSVVTLYRLSSAFERPIGYFFEDFEGPDSYSVRRDERKKMLLDDGEIQVELLSPNLKDKKMEALIIRIEKGHVSGEKTHIGEEVGLVVKGKICVSLEGNDNILEQGDSIYFPATIPHRIENIGDSEAVLYWVMTPPNF